MSKVFQIYNGVCYHDYTGMYQNAEDASRHYAPNIFFADAPDRVEDGWGFDETKEGDERFVEPPKPPDPEPTPELTPAQRRENAYNTEAVIEWDGDVITVTAAAQLWQYYAAEGSLKADALTALIAAAKEQIREKYPDVEMEEAD